MKHLFLVRHGDYNREDGDLSFYGMNQIEKLAKEMKSIAGDCKDYYIISSLAVRAQRSAQIIAKEFNVPTFDRVRELWPLEEDDLTYEEMRKIDNLIEPHKEKDVVALTTHYEVLESYPTYLVEKLFGKKVYNIPEVRKGEGFHLDLERKTYQMIPRRGL